MKKQNDSLRKLPKNDKHHLPTFNSLEEAESFYTPSPENQKLRDIRKLGDKLRKKHLSPMNMKKQYKVKEINNNGKIDGWEQGKYHANK